MSPPSKAAAWRPNGYLPIFINLPDVIETTDQLPEFWTIFDAPQPWMAKALGKTAEKYQRFTYQAEALA